MPQQNEPSKQPNTEKRYISRFVKTIAQWSPLGLTAYNLAAFIFKQEWVIAVMFGIATAISGIWAAYSKSLIERLSEIYTERGRLHADDLVTWIDSSVHSLNQFLRKWIVWQFSGFEAKYLKLQAEIVEEYTTEGFSQSQHATLMLEDVFVELGLKGLSNENNLNVWDLIRRSRKDKQFRQMMIIREGGFGKTTLLKHITWVYSKGKYKKYKVHRLIPFLIFLSLTVR